MKRSYTKGTKNEEKLEVAAPATPEIKPEKK